MWIDRGFNRSPHFLKNSSCSITGREGRADFLEEFEMVGGFGRGPEEAEAGANR